MHPFMNDEFLLKTETARTLYHRYAKDLPIIDYHCHINPREIYENRRFENLTQAWLEGDHYKWRVIRANGVPEKWVTGDGDDREKFQRYAEVMPKLIGNPLYHWTHLELKRYLHIDLPLSAETAEEIWNLSLERLPGLSVRGIIEASKVEVIGTTDDPADSLEWHAKLKDDPTFKTAVIPTFRPDKAVNIDKTGFADYVKKLGAKSLEDLKDILNQRLDFFVSMGCRASDHGLDYVAYRIESEDQVAQHFNDALEGRSVSHEAAEAYKTHMMLFLGRALCKRDLVMQIHYGASRNVNTAMFNKLGPDTGFDCISTHEGSLGLTMFLNALAQTGELPRAILYSLNPNDDAMLGSVSGCFGDRLRHGSAWWFNDTKDGMERQLRTLASLSVLGNFVGMLTDSRSFLSYTRHEYFRRILCNLLGQWVEDGEYPNDMAALAKLTSDISYHNAKTFFNITEANA